MRTPLHALTKTLRDDRTFTLNLVWRGPQERLGYWMQALIDGEVVADRFCSQVQREARIVGEGTTAGIEITMEVPDPANPGHRKLARRLVALTQEEADQIEAAKEEWTQRRIRRALAAAPDAPTREIFNLPHPLVEGVVWQPHPDEAPVMVLKVASHYLPEDGRSFHLDAEEGYLYNAVVRDATEEEIAEWEAGEG